MLPQVRVYDIIIIDEIYEPVLDNTQSMILFWKGVLGAKAEKAAARWMTKTEYGRVMRQLELDLASANTDLRLARAKRDGALVAVMVFIVPARVRVRVRG